MDTNIKKTTEFSCFPRDGVYTLVEYTDGPPDGFRGEPDDRPNMFVDFVWDSASSTYIPEIIVLDGNVPVAAFLAFATAVEEWKQVFDSLRPEDLYWSRQTL